MIDSGDFDEELFFKTVATVADDDYEMSGFPEILLEFNDDFVGKVNEGDELVLKSHAEQVYQNGKKHKEEQIKSLIEERIEEADHQRFKTKGDTSDYWDSKYRALKQLLGEVDSQ